MSFIYSCDFANYPFTISNVYFNEANLFNGHHCEFTLVTRGDLKYVFKCYADSSCTGVFSTWNGFDFSKLVGKFIFSVRDIGRPDDSAIAELDANFNPNGEELTMTYKIFEFELLDGEVFQFLFVNYSSNGLYDGHFNVDVLEK